VFFIASPSGEFYRLALQAILLVGYTLFVPSGDKAELAIRVPTAFPHITPGNYLDSQAVFTGGNLERRNYNRDLLLFTI
jgi:hypothetical protein